MSEGPFAPILAELRRLTASGEPVVAAIDGRCGSGKTTLADIIAGQMPCNICHMDDFYLPFPRRKSGWEGKAAGNMDLERFLREVLLPARGGQPILYRPYDCGSGTYLPAAALSPGGLTVVEGSYSLHPLLRPHYGWSLFLTCSKEEQARRLKAREGDRWPAFEDRWIPMEERYIRACAVEETASLVVDTTAFPL